MGVVAWQSVRAHIRTATHFTTNDLWLARVVERRSRGKWDGTVSMRPCWTIATNDAGQCI